MEDYRKEYIATLNKPQKKTKKSTNKNNILKNWKGGGLDESW